MVSSMDKGEGRGWGGGGREAGGVGGRARAETNCELQIAAEAITHCLMWHLHSLLLSTAWLLIGLAGIIIL